MNPQSYGAWLIISGALASTLAGFIWHKRSAPGGRALFVLLLAVMIWGWMYAGYWLSNSLEMKRLWLDLASIGVVFSSPAFFFLVLEFTGRVRWLTPRTYGVVAILPVLTLIMIWTDSLHNLYFGGLDISNPENLLHGGPWFWFQVTYSYAATVSAVVLLAIDLRKSSGMYRRQLGIILLGIFLPWVGNLVGLLGIPFFSGLDLTPIILLITCTCFAYGIFGLGLMDLVYTSRDVLVDTLEDGILVVDMQDRVVDINARALTYATPMDDSPIGKHIMEVFSRWTEVIEKHNLPEARFQLQLPDHPYSYMDVRILPLKEKTGRILGRLITWRDVTEEKRAEDALRVFRHAIEQSPSAILITDSEGHIDYVNHQFTHVTGYTLEEIQGRTPRILKSGETFDETYKQLWETVKRGETWEGELLNRKKNGDFYWAQELVAPVTDADGRVIRFVAMQQDITERKHTESELRMMNTRLQVQLMEIEHLHEQLREEAIRDSLTRLFNRRFMEETLDREISRADRAPVPISVVMMDVDLFKAINDSYGHQAGDTVLQTLGTLLLENTRISDIACRYGGDEMLVVMPGANLEQAANRAEEWRAAFSLLEFSLGDTRVSTTLSLGIASFPEHARTPNELLGAADKAMYNAKIRRNCVEIFNAGMQDQHFPSEWEH